MEHSDRGRHVTDQVSTWICNDRAHIEAARSVAQVHGTERLGQHLTTVIRQSPAHTAPWHVAQELAPNDYGRVDWQAVADDLKVE
jgi:hypothetical protein